MFAQSVSLSISSKSSHPPASISVCYCWAGTWPFADYLTPVWSPESNCQLTFEFLDCKPGFLFLAAFLFFFWWYSSACGIKLLPYLCSKGYRFCNRPCFMYDESLAFPKNCLCSESSCWVVILFSGSFWRQLLTKFLNSIDQSSCFDRVGGAEFRITSNTLIAGNSELGASPWANSIDVTPRDQISALKSYPSSLYSITSGAIQHGDPTNVCLLCPTLTCALTPKSLKNMFPSRSINILPAFMSLWIWPYVWKYSSPSRVCFKIVAIKASSLIPSLAFNLITSLRDPAPRRGITSQRSESSIKLT